MSVTDDEPIPNRVSQLLDAFLERLRSDGQPPSVEEFCRLAGADAEYLRPILETLLSLESLRNNTGDKLTDAHFRQTHLLAHLDGYRLIRVVGRGGMGIVFEGYEEAIGRRVAVKVLDHRHVANERALKRFLREAKATASLHHTNILPVFATGADQGTHYYVMPFVDGVNLSFLIGSLRSRIATGRPFVLTDLDLSAPADVDVAGLESVDAIQPFPLAKIDQSNVTRDVSYYLRVAKIAVQICDALHHANQHGIIHRDIKPSNVMIDSDRHIWVMDYGLVRAVDHEDLTETGELLGTLRYLAPERLQGIHTIQGDLFGLGMIMYELISLTTAFDASSREQLQQQILTSQPVSIAKIDRQIPRDLATIVSKAISPDPRNRYVDPAELLKDLESFLVDRPIASRRVSWTEHTWSWCRRNPAIASLLSCIAVLLIAIASISTYSAQSLRKERNTAQRIEQERRQILYESLLDEAKSRFLSGQTGQREQGLASLAQVLAIQPYEQLNNKQQHEVRNSAIACLSRTDLVTKLRLPTSKMTLHAVDVDPEFSYAALPLQGLGTEIVSLANPEDRFRLEQGSVQGVFHSERWFSPCGKWLYELFGAVAEPNSRRRVWDWRARRLVLDVPNVTSLGGGCFSPDGKLLFQIESARICVYDLDKGEKVRESEQRFRDARLFMEGNEQRILVLIRDQHPYLVDSHTFHEQKTLSDVVHTRCGVWDARANEFLLGAKSGVIHWNPAISIHDAYSVPSESRLVTDLQLSADGSLLAISSNDSVLIVAHERRLPLVSASGQFLRFSRDGQQIAIRRDGELCIELLSQSPVYQGIGRPVRYAQFSSRGNWLTTAGFWGVQLYNADSLSLVANLGLDPCGTVSWTDDENEVVTYGIFSHVSRWPITRSSARDSNEETHIRIGPPKSVLLNAQMARLGLDTNIPQHEYRFTIWDSREGALFFSDNRHGRIWEAPAEEGQPRPIIEQFGAGQFALSPDGRLLAVTRTPADETHIFDLQSNTKVHVFPSLASPVFSPDGKFLIATSRDEVLVLAVEDWQPVHRFPANRVHLSQTLPVAVQPEGKLIAYATSETTVRLVDYESGMEMAELRSDVSDEFLWLAFSHDGSRLAVTRRFSFGVWDLGALKSQLREHQIPAEFLPDRPERIDRKVAVSVDRGGDLLERNEWWQGYDLLATFESLKFNYADALDNLDSALRMLHVSETRSRAKVLVRRASFLQKLDMHRMALYDLRQALSLEPQDRQVIQALADFLDSGPAELQDKTESAALRLRLQGAN